MTSPNADQNPIPELVPCLKKKIEIKKYPDSIKRSGVLLSSSLSRV